MNLDEKMVENITKQTYQTQNQNLRLFAKVDLPIKLQVINHQKQIFHKLKSVYGDVHNDVLTLSSLILAINSVIGKIDDVTLNAIKLREKNHKTKIKRQKMLGYWAIIKTLKLEQNMSFRQISKYFAKYHKLEVSYSTIHTLWNKLENNTGEKI